MARLTAISRVVIAAGRGGLSAFHRALAWSPSLTRAYLTMLGVFLRSFDDSMMKRRVVRIVSDFSWPKMEFRRTDVRIGSDTHVTIVASTNEYHFPTLFSRELEYEREVFACLEPRMSNYDAVVEVGANIGLFTLFFSHYDYGEAPTPWIFAFEPSREAYFQLQRNLRINKTGHVDTFNCALADRTGLMRFYEPEGHLTNGSLIPEFAAVFSESIRSTDVLTVGGDIVEQLVAPYERLLLKIDAEGSEAQVLRGLEAMILDKSPDIVLEIVAPYDEEINRLGFLMDRYRRFNIIAGGLVERAAFVGGPYRDYLLVPRLTDLH